MNSLALCGRCHLRCPIPPIGSFKWELSLASFGCLTKLVQTTPHYYLKFEIYRYIVHIICSLDISTVMLSSLFWSPFKTCSSTYPPPLSLDWGPNFQEEIMLLCHKNLKTNLQPLNAKAMSHLNPCTLPSVTHEILHVGWEGQWHMRYYPWHCK